MNFAVVVGAGVSSTPYGVSDSACGVTPSPRPRGADALFEILRSPDPDPYPYPYPASASRVVLGETLVARRRLGDADDAASSGDRVSFRIDDRDTDL
jgi:hypothetical protein